MDNGGMTRHETENSCVNSMTEPIKNGGITIPIDQKCFL